MQSCQTRKQQSTIDGGDHQDPEEAFTLASSRLATRHLTTGSRNHLPQYITYVILHA